MTAWDPEAYGKALGEQQRGQYLRGDCRMPKTAPQNGEESIAVRQSKERGNAYAKKTEKRKAMASNGGKASKKSREPLPELSFPEDLEDV